MKRFFLIILQLILILSLSSCINGTGHLTIHENGSADLVLKVLIDQNNIFNNKYPFDDVYKKLNIDGFEVEEIVEDDQKGLIARKHYESIDSFSKQVILHSEGNMKDVIRKQVTVNTSEGFFKTTYHVNADINIFNIFDEYDGVSSWSPSVLKAILGEIKTDFKLTLPVPFGDNNADTVEDGGKTLGWNLSLTETNHLEFNVNVPNIKNIMIIIIGAILLFIMLVVYIKRKRRS